MTRRREGERLLVDAKTILLIDWPSRDVPDALARSGWSVVAQEGPERYVAYDADGEAVTPREMLLPPTQSDLVYAFRPLDELDDIVELARSLGARGVWLETTPSADDLPRTRATIESAGLAMASGPITEAARAARP